MRLVTSILSLAIVLSPIVLIAALATGSPAAPSLLPTEPDAPQTDTAEPGNISTPDVAAETPTATPQPTPMRSPLVFRSMTAPTGAMPILTVRFGVAGTVDVVWIASDGRGLVRRGTVDGDTRTIELPAADADTPPASLPMRLERAGRQLYLVVAHEAGTQRFFRTGTKSCGR